MSSDTPDILISREATVEVGGEDLDGAKRINDFISESHKKQQTIPTKFFALGGLGEVGKNTYCIEHDDEIILIDAGIKFVNKKLYPGFTGTVVGVDYLKKNKSKIKGLYVTHGHEDHIGGISYMLKEVDIPEIFASALCTELIKRKLNERGFGGQKITVFSKKSVFNTKHFVIDFFKVNHSIPDAFGMCVITPNGIIVSSGDFRFDFGSKNDKFDLQKLQQIAVRNVDLLLCESTNSSLPGFNESEKVVINELNNIISSSKGRVIITFFASNLGRIEEIIKIAISCKRKIIILGRSIASSIDASQRIGYLKINKKVFIHNSDINNYEDHEILIICTGSQGEENSTLSNVAKSKYQWLKLKPTDNIIFSSNVIPGNFSSVNDLINQLYKSGCDIFVNSANLKIHSSGHASKLEQQLFISLVNAKSIIPIHGETFMLKELKRNCIEVGYSEKNIFILENGQVAELLNRNVTLTDHIIDTTPSFILCDAATSHGLKILKRRETLGKEGMLSQHIYVDLAKKEILAVSPITNIGSFYLSDSIHILKKINKLIYEKIKNLIDDNGATVETIKEMCLKILRDEILRTKKQKPIIELFVTDQSAEKLFENAITSEAYVNKQMNAIGTAGGAAPAASSAPGSNDAAPAANGTPQENNPATTDVPAPKKEKSPSPKKDKNSTPKKEKAPNKDVPASDTPTSPNSENTAV